MNYFSVNRKLIEVEIYCLCFNVTLFLFIKNVNTWSFNKFGYVNSYHNFGNIVRNLICGDLINYFGEPGILNYRIKTA